MTAAGSKEFWQVDGKNVKAFWSISEDVEYEDELGVDGKLVFKEPIVLLFEMRAMASRTLQVAKDIWCGSVRNLQYTVYYVS